MPTYRVAVCASGRGSNLAALIDGLRGTEAGVVLVLSNRPDAGALAIAEAHAIPTHVFADPADSGEWMQVLGTGPIDLVVLAGYLKAVPPDVTEEWAGRMINIHPSLLPAHGGAGMYGLRVHRAVLAAGDPRSGATVHLVTPEYDQGPILGQKHVPILPEDTPETLAARVLAVEHPLLTAAVRAAARAGRPVPFATSSVPSFP